jgi:hypothetical protein
MCGRNEGLKAIIGCYLIGTLLEDPMLDRTRDKKATSWIHLQELLFVDCYDKDIDRHRSPYAFRGLPDAAHELKTSLIRLGGEYAKMERHLLRNFRKYAGTEVVSQDLLWNWLSLAQHHGLPTRILDWTYSPYVALHFATENTTKANIDGAIWCVDFKRISDYLPPSLHADLEKEKALGFTVEMLNARCRTLDEFDALKSGSDDFVVFFEPPSIDSRIVNQFALHSIMSNSQMLLNDWLNKHPDSYYRVVIPASLKWEVRDKLDQANITERVMFPGLDGLSDWLRRWYGTKTP